MSSTLTTGLSGGQGQGQIIENYLCRNHTTTVASRIPLLLNKVEDTSDVKFIFKINDGEEKVIYGHKLILGMASSVFYKMFFNRNMTPVQDEVRMEQHIFSHQSFSKFIKVLYMAKIGPALFEGLSVDIIVEMLSCADFYDVPYVKEELVKYLVTILTKVNVIPILVAGLMSNETDLADKCLFLIDEHSEFVFASEEMLGVKAESLLEVFKRDTLDVEEGVLLDLAMKWAETQCEWERENVEGSDENKRKLLGLAFFEIRFTLLPPAKFSEIVNSGLLTTEECRELLLQYQASGSQELKDNRIERQAVFKTNHRLFGLKKMADRVGEIPRESLRTVGRKFQREEISRRRLKSGVKVSIAEADLFMIGFGNGTTEDQVRVVVEQCGTDVKVIKLGGQLGAFNVRFSYNPYRFNLKNFFRSGTFGFPEVLNIFICPWLERKKYAQFTVDGTEETQG